MNRLTFFISVFLVALAINAQHEESVTPTRRLMLGVGSADVMDTYLSPYSYKGTRLSLSVESHYPHTMHRLAVHGAAMENMAGNVNEYDAAISYALAHHFDLSSIGRFNLKAGPMGQVYAGCIYNERNGNNPAQAKLSAMCCASAVASYTFDIKGRHIGVEYSISIPVLGLAYSPQFGQSYYEEFVLGQSDHNCVIAHTFNTPALRHRLLLDFPLKRTSVYVGYEGVADQSKYNNLRYHSYSHSFTFGFRL